MDSNLALILVTVFLLVYFFLAYMSMKTWRVVHVLMVFLVLISAAFFTVLAAAALRTQQVWRTEVNQLRLDVADLQQQRDELANGKLMEVVQTTASLRSEKAELHRALIDRGRVWRNATVIQVLNGPPQQISLTIVAPALEGEQQVVHRIDEKMVLHAFSEVQTEEPWKTPGPYLGEFEVTARNDTTITITPTLPLTAAQQGQLQAGTWTLYETMPLDSYYAFENLDGEALRKLAPRNNLPGDVYEAIIDQYVRHGTNQIQPTDPPERVWRKIRFKRPHQVAVDSDQSATAPSQGFFDMASGRTIYSKLKQTEAATSFDIGETAIFDPQTAQKLIDDGVGEEIEKIYIRPLHDYAAMLRDIHRQKTIILAKNAAIDQYTKTLEATIEKGREQQAFREEERTKLQHDVAGFQREQKAITQVVAEFEKQIAAINAQKSQLYRGNNDLASRLVRIRKYLADKINAANAAAAAAGQEPAGAKEAEGSVRTAAKQP